jgi:integrase
MRQHIDKSHVRNSLPPRREPYWGAPVERGLYLGFRKLDAGWGTWIARLRDEEGRQRYKSLGHASNDFDYDGAKQKAVAWAKAARAGVETGELKTVADACRAYVENRRKQKGEGTAHDAKMRFQRYVYENSLGSVLLDRLRQRHIEGWRDKLLEPSAPTRPGLSKASANRTLTSLKAALNFAVNNRYISADRTIEWALVKSFKGANRRRDLYLDLGQRRKLLGEAKGAVRSLIEGAMYTGARAGELTSALRSQFDSRTMSITLRGKTGERKVPLHPGALPLFERLSKDKLPSAPLFTRDDGRPWAHSDWDELVRDAAARADLPKGVCLYTLRHSFITEAISGGMTALEAARIVGTSLPMIDRHYGHLAQTAARERMGQICFV